MDVSQTLVPTLIEVSQPRVIHPQQPKQSCVDIVVHDGMLDRTKTEFVSCSVDAPSLDTSAGKPHRKRIRMMIATVASFRERGAPKLAAPEHQGRIKQSASLQISQEAATVSVFAAILLCDPVRSLCATVPVVAQMRA